MGASAAWLATAVEGVVMRAAVGLSRGRLPVCWLRPERGARALRSGRPSIGARAGMRRGGVGSCFQGP
eukprot:6422557-Lingulodinium_polyedra.AAC.1